MAKDPHQGRRVAAGWAIIALLLACGAAVFSLDELARATTKNYELVVLFPQAPRLRPGTRVTVAGHPVGSVRRIAHLRPGPDTTARVAVMLQLPVEVQPQIRRDSEARIASPRLMGDPVIEIRPGSLAAPMLGPGDTVRAAAPAQLAATLASLRSLRPAVDSLLAEARVMEARLDITGGPVGDRLARIERDIKAARFELRRFQLQVDQGPLGQLLADQEVEAALERIQSNLAALGPALERSGLTGTGETRAEINALGPEVRRLAQRTAAVRAQIDSLQGRMAQQGSFPTRLARDSALTAALRGARAQLDSLVAEVKKNPARFVF